MGGGGRIISPWRKPTPPKPPTPINPLRTVCANNLPKLFLCASCLIYRKEGGQVARTASKTVRANSFYFWGGWFLRVGFPPLIFRWGWEFPNLVVSNLVAYNVDAEASKKKVLSAALLRFGGTCVCALLRVLCIWPEPPTRGRKNGAAQKLSKSVEQLFDTFWRFLPHEENSRKVSKNFWHFLTILTFFDVAPFRRPLSQSADLTSFRTITFGNFRGRARANRESEWHPRAHTRSALVAFSGSSEHINCYFARSPENFCGFFFEFAWEFCIEKCRGFLVIFFGSPFPTKRSTKTSRIIRGKFWAKFGAKFGTKNRKIRGTFVLRLVWPNQL